MMGTIRLVEKKNIFFTLSVVLILLGFLLMGLRGMRGMPTLAFGIDFSGGSTMTLRLQTLPKDLTVAQLIQKVRVSLEPFGLQGSDIQLLDRSDVLIKSLKMEASDHEKIQQAMEATFGQCDIVEVDFMDLS